jgi:cytochrome c oxidase cbb3-type subunit 3
MRMTLGGAALALWFGASACDRGVEDGAGSRMPQAGLTRGQTLNRGPGVAPGISPEAVLGAIENPYAGDPAAIAVGRQLFIGFNCAGCHSAYAGGGMGPNLRDSLWIYGGNDVQIFSTIAEGRPNGMPAWAGRIPDDQIWQLVAYIKALGTRQDPARPPTPSRSQAPESPEAKGAGSSGS